MESKRYTITLSAEADAKLRGIIAERVKSGDCKKLGAAVSDVIDWLILAYKVPEK